MLRLESWLDMYVGVRIRVRFRTVLAKVGRAGEAAASVLACCWTEAEPQRVVRATLAIAPYHLYGVGVGVGVGVGPVLAVSGQKQRPLRQCLAANPTFLRSASLKASPKLLAFRWGQGHSFGYT